MSTPEPSSSGTTVGATVTEGGVRFRLWAPGSREVEVMLESDAGIRDFAMSPTEGGYFEALVPEAGAGSRYSFRLDGEGPFPDPASRSQPGGVHAPSEVIDPHSFEWTDAAWRGTPLEELVIYELHVGTFSPEGTFDGAAALLPELVELNVTAIELMPVADFPGARNWGYDGVSLFAPAAAYGGPVGLQRLVDAAHALGLAVLLDVVYNHLGPDGNYLPAITGGRFFTDRHHTPWGDAIAFEGPHNGPVRDFVIQNALYWLRDYHIDGLRLDATHAMLDQSEPHILAELAERVHALPGRRRLLIAEDERHEERLLLPRAEGGYGLDGVWADDLHHQIRRHLTGDAEGYFAPYSGTAADIAATLRKGWWRPWTGAEESASRSPPGGGSAPIARYVQCIQNHDQIGNRALGERLNHKIEPGAYRAASALLLLSAGTPLLFMGQEWAASTPFLFFTDHTEELGESVTRGRRDEFAGFSAFRDPALRERIPDPQLPDTFERSRLKWAERSQPRHESILRLYRTLLAMRRDQLPADFDVQALGKGALAVRRGGLLAIVNLRGEIRVDLGEKEITAAGEGRAWLPVLATEEVRFGGDGAWGRMEADGVVHLTVPGAVILESSGARSAPSES